MPGKRTNDHRNVGMYNKVLYSYNMRIKRKMHTIELLFTIGERYEKDKICVGCYI